MGFLCQWEPTFSFLFCLFLFCFVFFGGGFFCIVCFFILVSHYSPTEKSLTNYFYEFGSQNLEQNLLFEVSDSGYLRTWLHETQIQRQCETCEWNIFQALISKNETREQRNLCSVTDRQTKSQTGGVGICVRFETSGVRVRGARRNISQMQTDGKLWLWPWGGWNGQQGLSEMTKRTREKKVLVCFKRQICFLLVTSPKRWNTHIFSRSFFLVHTCKAPTHKCTGGHEGYKSSPVRPDPLGWGCPLLGGPAS